MFTNALAEIRDYLHALACYHLFITPIPLEKQYRSLAEKACKFITTKRTELIDLQHPRHHVIHRFSQPSDAPAKKILITHGWLSRSAYMARFIRALHQQGYEVYALDFPAHGESKGLQLTWTEAVIILKLG